MTLESGFTTVREMGTSGFSDVSLMHAIERDDFPGPRIVPAGNAIGATGGHCDSTGCVPGLFANIVAVPGNPLADIQVVESM